LYGPAESDKEWALALVRESVWPRKAATISQDKRLSPLEKNQRKRTLSRAKYVKENKRGKGWEGIRGGKVRNKHRIWGHNAILGGNKNF